MISVGNTVKHCNDQVREGLVTHVFDDGSVKTMWFNDAGESYNHTIDKEWLENYEFGN